MDLEAADAAFGTGKARMSASPRTTLTTTLVIPTTITPSIGATAADAPDGCSTMANCGSSFCR